MKKFMLVILTIFTFILVTSCTTSKVFESSFKEGRYIGSDGLNDVTIKFREIDIMQYVKSNSNVVKDLSTTDTKFYTPYSVNIEVKIDEKLHQVNFRTMKEKNLQTTCEYVITDLDTTLVNLGKIHLTLIDADQDGVSEKLDCELVFSDNTLSMELVNNDERRTLKIKDPYNLAVENSFYPSAEYLPGDKIMIHIANSSTLTLDEIYLELSTGEIYYLDQKNNNLKFSFAMPNHDLTATIKSVELDEYIEKPYFASGKLVSFNHTFKLGVHSTIEDLGSIITDTSLTELFNTPYTDQYLIDHYYALYFRRTEEMMNDLFREVTYSDLFLENGQIYVTANYNCPSTIEGDAIMASYQDLILIPKSWKKDIKVQTNYEVKINRSYSDNQESNFLTYDMLNEIKEAFKVCNNLSNATLDEIHVNCYSNNNQSVIVFITCDWFDYPAVVWSETVAGVTIVYGDGNRCLVYNKQKFYILQEAYDLGFITEKDLEILASR